MILSALLIAALTAPGDRLEVKGLGLGDTFAQMQQVWRGNQCSTTKIVRPGTVSCYRQDTFAGVPATLAASLDRSVVVSIAVVGVPQSDFETAVTALLGKYGTPASDKTETVSNAMGATFSNRVVRWTSGDTHLTATERGGNISKSMFLLVSEAELRTQANLRKRAAESDL